MAELPLSWKQPGEVLIRHGFEYLPVEPLYVLDKLPPSGRHYHVYSIYEQPCEVHLYQVGGWYWLDELYRTWVIVIYAFGTCKHGTVVVKPVEEVRIR